MTATTVVDQMIARVKEDIVPRNSETREAVGLIIEELEQQRSYNAKLEEDFQALMKDRNELVEKNRACCDENERLRAALVRIVECGCLNGDDYIEELHEAKNALNTTTGGNDK